jgi:Mg-chelatase subunit ChlD
MQAELDDLLVEDPDLLCPVTLMLLLDPVIASDGCVYERMAVAELSRAQGVSPITRAPLTGQVVAASDHGARVRAFMHRRCTDLIGFIARAKKQGRPLMAMTAIDRLKDYIAALSPQSEPHLAKQCVDLCLELGRVPPSFNSPQERISRVLKDQVARAKAEGETVLQERSAACGSEKSVVFCVDTSGSMRGSRIEKAQENLLMIFDQYMEDEDSMSLVSFSNSTETRIDMQEIAEGRRSRLRCMIDAGFNVGGGTAFWDALATCVDTLKQSPPGQQQWIVALTDGEDRHSKRHTLESARAAVQAAEGKANLIVIGIQLSPGLKPDMQRLCTATEKSIFIDASGDLSSLDAAFQQVAEMICE